MKAILLIDHGSKREEANEMLACVRGMVQEQAGPDVLIGYAHMELAERAGIESRSLAGLRMTGS